MIEPVLLKNTVGQAELQDGDIICFQKALPEQEYALTLSNDLK
jgi:hypothetical protein